MATKLTGVILCLINYSSLISLKIIRFHSYINKTWQRTHLPSTCDWKYGRNATELRHAAKLNGQQHHREDCQDRATVLLVCAGDGLKLRRMVIFKSAKS